jgi:hypothetical protein
MHRYDNAKRESQARRASGIEEPWRPIIIGNPHHSTRHMCILKLDSMSRFSEIRRKNRLVDEQSLEARHPNHQLLADVKLMIHDERKIVHNVGRSLSRHSSREAEEVRLVKRMVVGELEEVSRKLFLNTQNTWSNAMSADIGDRRFALGQASQRRRATTLREAQREDRLALPV